MVREVLLAECLALFALMVWALRCAAAAGREGEASAPPPGSGAISIADARARACASEEKLLHEVAVVRNHRLESQAKSALSTHLVSSTNALAMRDLYFLLPGSIRTYLT